MNKDDLREALLKSRTEFMQAVEGLSDDELQQPGVIEQWSVKDILFHLSMWEAELVKFLWQAAQGQTPTTFQLSETPMDEINAAWARQSQTRSLEKVWDDFHSVRKQTLRRLDDLEERDLNDPGRFSWLKGQPLWIWIAEDSFRHEQEHSDQIKYWRSLRKL